MKRILLYFFFLFLVCSNVLAYKLPKAYGIINVTDFGAIPNDGKDDTEGIQAAIENAKSLRPKNGMDHNSCKEKNIFVVYLPEGTYCVDNTLYIDSATTEEKSYRIILMGESEENTIIKLKNNCAGFTDKSSPKAVWRTINTEKSNISQNYSIADITFNIGNGNPGAIAVDHFNNNLGSVKNVKIVCPDLNNKGVIGFKYDRLTGGICYINNLEISGFETGIVTASAEIDLVFENIYISDCSVGFKNKDKSIQLKDFVTDRVDMPVFQTGTSANMIIINAKFNNTKTNKPAIVREAGQLYLRNIKTNGFGSVCESLEKKSVNEYVYGKRFSLWGAENLGSLKLKVKDVPNPERTSVSDWKIVDCDAQEDDTETIQKAIDSGAKTIFLTGKNTIDISNPIILRGQVERFHGGWGKLWYGKLGVDRPAIFIETGKSTQVIIECFGYINGIVNNSSQNVVIRSLWLSQNKLDYETIAKHPGDLHIEEVCPRTNTGNAKPIEGPSMIFRNQNVYVRDLNIEGFENPLLVINSKVWLYGFKFGEKVSNPAIDIQNDSKVEVLGGLINGPSAKDKTIFKINNSEVSIVGVNQKNGGVEETAGIFISETQKGITMELPTTKMSVYNVHRLHCPLYRSMSVVNDEEDSTDDDTHANKKSNNGRKHKKH